MTPRQFTDEERLRLLVLFLAGKITVTQYLALL